MKRTFNDVAHVHGYHIHIYFNEGDASENDARTLAEELERRFPEGIKSNKKIGAIGPHTKQNYALELSTEAFAEVVAWTQVNAMNTSVLIHPETGSDLFDHLYAAMWVGPQVPFRTSFIGKFYGETERHKPKP